MSVFFFFFCSSSNVAHFLSVAWGLVQIQSNLGRWMQNEIHSFWLKFHLHLKVKGLKDLVVNKNNIFTSYPNLTTSTLHQLDILKIC